MFRNLKVDFGHVLLLAILLVIIYMAVKKVSFSIGMCSCPKTSVKEGMSNLAFDCQGACDRAQKRDISGYTEEDYTPLY